MTLYIENFDIVEALKGVGSTVQPLVKKNHNELQINCPSDVGIMRADLTKLRQTLFNLISNAAKFTENGTIQLEVQVSDETKKNSCRQERFFFM